MNILNISKAYAQQLIPCADGTMADPSIGCVKAPAAVANPETGIAEVILNIASAFMGIVIFVSVILIIYGGITYALAAGDDTKISKSKRVIMWSIGGLIVAFLARAGAQFILGIVTQ